MEDWGAVRERLVRLCELSAKDVPCQDDIRAALERDELLVLQLQQCQAALKVATEMFQLYCGECGQPGECACLGNWRKRAEAAEAKLARCVEALDRVLTEAGLQAHKHGCPERVRRPARWDEFAPCAGCQAEAALAAAKREGRADLPDWAKDRAREWWDEWGTYFPLYYDDDSPAEELRKEEEAATYNRDAQSSLAALLVEGLDASRAEVARLEGLILEAERHMEALLNTLGASKHYWIVKVHRAAKGAWEARRIRAQREESTVDLEYMKTVEEDAKAGRLGIQREEGGE